MRNSTFTQQFRLTQKDVISKADDRLSKFMQEAWEKSLHTSYTRELVVWCKVYFLVDLCWFGGKLSENEGGQIFPPLTPFTGSLMFMPNRAL